MVFWLASGVGLAIAYLYGSTPTGCLAGKLLKGIDIREHGSKSIGATNVLRTLVEMACVGRAPNRCAERCGGDRLCPLVLYLVLYIAVRHATDSFPNFHIESPVVIGLPKPRPQASSAHSFTLWSAADYSGSCRTSRVPSSPPLESRYYVNRSEEGG
jgi:hypothetical protein